MTFAWKEKVVTMGEGSGTAEGRRKHEKKKNSRTKLLDAAFLVYTERGYEGASLERVAEAAGFSKGAVYSNFASKDELFFELLASRIDEGIESSRIAAEKQRKGRSRAGKGDAAARAIGRELRSFVEANPEWQLLFFEFWLRCVRNEKLRAQLAERRRAWREKIAESVETRVAAEGAHIGRTEAMDFATTVLALSNGLGIEGLIDPKAAPPRLFGELMSRIIAGSSFALSMEEPETENRHTSGKGLRKEK
jgi:AcrR family transcriptional regulator